MEQKLVSRGSDNDWFLKDNGALVCADWVAAHLRLPDGYDGPLWIILSKERVAESWKLSLVDLDESEDCSIMIEGADVPVAVFHRFWEMVKGFNGFEPVYLSFDFEEC